MARNLYHVLEASETASQATIQTLFEQKRDRLQAELDAGNPSVKEHLWAVTQAHGTLSNPVKKTVPKPAKTTLN